MLNSKSILIVRLSALGDVIHTLPVLSILKAQYPNAKIGWVVSKKAKALLENHPLIDELHIFEGFKPHKLFPLLQQIKKNNYDAAIDFQGLLKSSLIPLLANIPNRVGFSDAREGASCFYTLPVTPSISFLDHTQPVVERYVELLEKLDCKRPEKISYPLPDFEVSNLDNSKTIALSLFTAWKSKNWPLTHWKILIELLLKNTDYEVAILGDANPEHLIKIQTEILNPIHSSRLKLIELPISQLPHFLSQTKMVISGDSFILHLAGAIAKPICIGLYGPTSSLRTPPPNPLNRNRLLNLNSSLSCMPCHQKKCPLSHHQCLTELRPETVYQAIQAQLS